MLRFVGLKEPMIDDFSQFAKSLRSLSIRPLAQARVALAQMTATPSRLNGVSLRRGSVCYSLANSQK
jgi:hypothetical protein